MNESQSFDGSKPRLTIGYFAPSIIDNSQRQWQGVTAKPVIHET